MGFLLEILVLVTMLVLGFVAASAVLSFVRSRAALGPHAPATHRAAALMIVCGIVLAISFAVSAVILGG
ncbi:hypothetical protein [Microbacterium gorillae]|uniref:hypothetical protein n=1 Tax=Microbacterium gorillae TaxID=1231063 RepID=UPI00058D57C4|nr:hypothetical protein [Microbacterium gorillae]